MGYQINSTWTKLRKNDIEHLNTIIDNEYCKEQEIARKLNILAYFEKKLEDAIRNFNFYIVIDFMQKNNWTWALYKNGKSYYSVPTRSDIIDSIRSDFNQCIYKILELGKKEAGVSSGGIVIDMGINGDYANNDNCWVEIYFDIAHFVKD